MVVEMRGHTDKVCILHVFAVYIHTYACVCVWICGIHIYDVLDPLQAKMVVEMRGHTDKVCMCFLYIYIHMLVCVCGFVVFTYMMC